MNCQRTSYRRGTHYLRSERYIETALLPKLKLGQNGTFHQTQNKSRLTVKVRQYKSVMRNKGKKVVVTQNNNLQRSSSVY